jgi:hypothetical protein
MALPSASRIDLADIVKSEDWVERKSLSCILGEENVRRRIQEGYATMARSRMRTTMFGRKW